MTRQWLEEEWGCFVLAQDVLYIRIWWISPVSPPWCHSSLSPENNIKKPNCDKSVVTPDVSRLDARSLLCHWGSNIVRLGLSLADKLWSWGNDKVRHPDTISPIILFYLFLSRLLFLAFLANCIDMRMATCPMVSTIECGKEVITSHNPPRYHSHQSPCQIGRMEEDKTSVCPPPIFDIDSPEIKSLFRVSALLTVH